MTIYTDGACSGNPGKGGYGVLMMTGKHFKELSAGYKKTTNNRMELLAVVVALESLKKQGIEVEIYSDSKYVVDAINKGWLKSWIAKDFKDKKNPDLWLRYHRIARQFKVKVFWVKGHANNPYNNRCDELAVAAAQGDNLLVDVGYIAQR